MAQHTLLRKCLLPLINFSFSRTNGMALSNVYTGSITNGATIWKRYYPRVLPRRNDRTPEQALLLGLGVPTLALQKVLAKFDKPLNLEEIKRSVRILRRHGFLHKNNQIGKLIIRCPSLLVADPEEIEATFEFFASRGVEEHVTRGMILRHPQILNLSKEYTMKPVFEALESLGFSRKLAADTISKAPNLFLFDLETQVLPGFLYLDSLGMSPNDMAFFVRNQLALWDGNPNTVEKEVNANLEFFVKKGMTKETAVKMLSSISSIRTCREEYFSELWDEECLERKLK